MSVSGIPFIWDGTASEVYGLSLMSINSYSIEGSAGSGVELITDEIVKCPELLFLGAKQLPVLEFSLEFISESDMDIYKQIQIKDWLFGKLGYKKLQICLEGFDTYYFNCQLKADKDYCPPCNNYRGFKCNVICDSSFAWQNIKKKTIPHNGANYSTYRFNNVSADSEDLKPIIKFTVGSDAKFKIVNKSYNDLTFEWNNLQSGEVITCDCKTGIITSSTGLKRFSNFNKNFMRMKKGLNNLEFWYNATSVSFEYKNAIRLGGVFY